MKQTTTIMNFSDIYYQEHFYESLDYNFLDCSKLEGTNCYCSNETEQILLKMLSQIEPSGIHFIDSGNYHYVTKLWLGKLLIPFTLILFDHHPDMQPTLINTLTSCGSWVKDTLEQNPNLKQVILIGASNELCQSIPLHYQSKIIYFTKESIQANPKKILAQLRALPTSHPIYISIDKDVLCSQDASTQWSQGTMTLPVLSQLLSPLLSHPKLLGIDICGEQDNNPLLPHFEEQVQKNDTANRILLTQYLSLARLHSKAS
ncbi:arginase family protein [Velocimicrobium porci]|uniref:Arginase family protein n=1 Tax=Velocimicrobium porci TaxID=2606634 RepID=A0A6L5Y1G7_9FIRM|nr:arginase family protein [Velocimicrobium porci]MSS64842.1 arginase family protein [Velocimicrobium porci]